MDIINLQSKDLIKENIEKIAELFPNIITEKDGEKKIDFEALKQELSDTVIEGNEKYQLTWPGKKSSILLANTPTNYSLKPVPEESVDFENTQNLYIEGDNLEVLKILQESYTGKIKCIYIDPPYNTGNDFVYKDDFKQSREEYALESGELSEENEKLVSNPETSGRYHSDWLSMMYPRLKLARNLLSEDGVIFISISDVEVVNLEKITNEIFGEENLIVKFIWEKTQHFGRQKINFYSNCEYIICYAKEIRDRDTNSKKELLVESIISDLEDAPLYNASNNISELEFPPFTVKFNIPDGEYTETEDEKYTILNPVIVENSLNKNSLKLKFRSRWSQSNLNYEISNGTSFIVKSRNFSIRAIYSEDKEANDSPKQLIFTNRNNPMCAVSRFGTKVGTSEEGTSELRDLFDGNQLFDYPKPTSLIEYLLSLIFNEGVGNFSNEGVFLDFFSGSNTFMHSILKLNSKDNGKRKIISVQLDELIDDSKARNSKEKNEILKKITYLESINLKPYITEIGKERIRRAAKKIKEETNAVIDYGFRVYKLSEPIYENTKISPKEQTQNNLFEENIRDNVSNSEILTSVILDLGLELSLKTEEKIIDDKRVYLVEDNYLFACFERNIDLSNDSEMMKEIIKLKPQRIALLDSSFKDNQDKINFDNLIKQNLPECKGIKIV